MFSRLICWSSLSLFISVKLPTILLLFNHLSNLSGKLSEFLETGSYVWHKIIVLDDYRISLTTSLGERNSLPKFRKAAVCPVISHLAVLRVKRMKGSFSDQQSCLSWKRSASRGFRSLFFRSTGLACGWYTGIRD
ncbi:hypothetical protein TNCV_1099941 [Trichonephila clavipes]|nr:hypothetical protein TNCV_1099941 [Trichonephila clavipes]